MPCGCQGGSTYTPPGFQSPATTEDGQAVQEPALRGGPTSPGYYHGPAPTPQPVLQDAK